jgi:Flp pilus assembly pilin Flp
MEKLKRFLGPTEGQDLIEYALLTSLIAVTLVVALSSVGVKVSSSFQNVSSAVSTAGASGSGANGNNGNGNNGNNGNNGSGNNGNNGNGKQ